MYILYVLLFRMYAKDIFICYLVGKEMDKVDACQDKRCTSPHLLHERNNKNNSNKNIKNRALRDATERHWNRKDGASLAAKGGEEEKVSDSKLPPQGRWSKLAAILNLSGLS